LALVADVSALTAEALRLNQKLAGIEMDVLRLQLEIGRTGAGIQLVRDLHEAEQNAAAAREACMKSKERIMAIEGEIADVDLALAKATSDNEGEAP
jgi:outer membrane protein assembly factor BamD (BamD/ComL family)